MRFEPDIEAKDSKGEMPLYLAAANGHVKIVRWLLENGANVNFQVSITKMTPLHVAAKNGHQDVVMALMAAGADANYITVFEESPLCIAARHGHQAVVQSLIAAGADVNSINFCEESPLYIAARQGHQAVAHSLIGAGANVNSKDELQRSPLFEAAKYGHQAVVQSLIAAGANVDCKDCLQNSPLHIAALRGHKEVARLLLQRSRELNVVIEEKVLMIVDVLMSSSSETQKRADTDQDLQSVASVGTFSDSGFYSGSQISQALIMAAKEQLLEIFATDGELQVLYKESTQKISREKFIRNFKRLMRKYCLELKPRANPIEKGIVIFLGRQAIWFADEIYRAFKPVDVSLRNAMDGLAKQKPDKIRQLDKFLSQHMQGFPLEDMETQQIRDDDGGENGNKSDASDSGGSDGDVSLDPDIEDPYFQGINLLKDFLVSGTPFQNLKENFRQFVRQNCPKHLIIIPEVCEQSRDATTITSPSPSFPGIRSTSYRLLVFNYLRRLFRPRIMDGYQRITWNCGCGESMYSDVKELYSGGAQSLQETLRLSAAAVSEAASNQTNIMTPSPAHLHSADTGQGSSCDQKSPIRPLDTDLSSTPTTDNAPDGNTEPLTAEIVKRYLLLCVNTSKRVHLEQIDVTYTGDDQVLFQGIRQAYYNTRKSQNTGYFLTIPGFLALLFGEISFSRPKLANFVRVHISYISEDGYN
jgi:ankyrin repeat protein